jgi:phospholipase C
MDSRRDFLKKALFLGAGGALAGVCPESIQRAFAIDPPAGSTYLDAEHVVILMQENRSFDHIFGMLQGVRGYNDPRAMTLPNGNPVWLQSNAAGKTYAPFRLDIKDTNATWEGSLPHGRESQLGARHEGKHDHWLDAKQNGDEKFAHVPLTMGYYTRADLPFYYALADAFTVCDQNFCSSLTPTTPNRLHLWTGTVRPEAAVNAKAHVNNEDTDYDAEASWRTFPERLEEWGISWRIYQNEINLPSGLTGEHDAWLTNFSDNPLEWFTQYAVRFSATHQAWLATRAGQLPGEIQELEASPKPYSSEVEKQLASKRAELAAARHEMDEWSAANFAKLSEFRQNLHRKAFTTNTSDPECRELTTLKYQENGAERQMQVPKGDVLQQFREDVRTGKLPTVSWLVPPERFSDHPSSPWYGAWYFSETFDILTQNPEVWKKTIFILCYDENDGYFDHISPFVPPHPHRADTGKVSGGIDPALERVSSGQETGSPPIGLGFRVPLLIASPWSRGGFVNSQVCDHTSILMFLEKFLSQKTGQPVRETNITQWRRTVCGDLTSVFRPYSGEKIELPEPLEKTALLETIHEAQNKPEPKTYRHFTAEEAAKIRANPAGGDWLAEQEKGARPSCPLPYELAMDGAVDAGRGVFVLQLAAKNERFGARTAGAPYHLYSPVKWRDESEPGHCWDYAVAAGDRLSDEWKLADFEGGIYHLRAHGPNGFYREFHGDAQDPAVKISLTGTADGRAEIAVSSGDAVEILIEDLSYGGGQRQVSLAAGGSQAIAWKILHGWHDFRVSASGKPQFWRRYAGRIETGRDSMTDPFMGRALPS